MNWQRNAFNAFLLLVAATLLSSCGGGGGGGTYYDGDPYDPGYVEIDPGYQEDFDQWEFDSYCIDYPEDEICWNEDYIPDEENFYEDYYPEEDYSYEEDNYYF